MTETDSERGRAFAFADDEVAAIRESLVAWYREHRRTLPWRGIDDPYGIWVAEVMLQQTQVATVVDYYRRWMEVFPTVEAVAGADIDDVLELWEGLGFYRRARFLHRSARRVVEEYGGELPDERDELEELPGIGPYTAGAVASIAFDRPTPLVDGNVSRVLSRLRAIPGDPQSTENEKIYWRLAERLVDPDDPGDFNQALMELGATVCTPESPSCLLCPVRDHCRAFEEGQPEAYPDASDRGSRRQMDVATAVPVRRRSGEREFFVVKRPPDGLLAGLWEFPSVELSDGAAPDEAIDGFLGGQVGWDDRAWEARRLESFTHLFSHIEMSIEPYVHLHGADGSADGGALERPARWVAGGELDEVPMSAAMRRVERSARDALDG